MEELWPKYIALTSIKISNKNNLALIIFQLKIKWQKGMKESKRQNLLMMTMHNSSVIVKES